MRNYINSWANISEWLNNLYTELLIVCWIQFNEQSKLHIQWHKIANFDFSDWQCRVLRGQKVFLQDC